MRPPCGRRAGPRSGVIVALQAQEVELALEIARRREADMAPAAWRQHAAARRALHEALLHEEGLDHILERVALVGERRRQRLDAHRPAAVILGEAAEIAA